MKVSYRNTKKINIFSWSEHAEIKILTPLYWIPSTVLMLSPHCTDVILPHVLMLSPQCTEYPPQYWSYPPTVLMLSPTVLNNLRDTEGIPHSTEGIHPQYWSYPPHVLLLSPIVLKVSLHSTDVSPTVLMLSPRMYWCYPPLYWTTSTILKLSPHSTEAIPPLYWSYPPTVLMWSPDVLNNLQCTEQPPQYWTDVIWGDNFSTIPFMKILSVDSNSTGMKTPWAKF